MPPFPNSQSNPAAAIPVWIAPAPDGSGLAPKTFHVGVVPGPYHIADGPGVAQSISVNSLVAGATITVYDSLTGSGTVIALITLPADVSTVSPFVLAINAPFTVGLSVTTSGTTDLTVVYTAEG